MKVLDDDLTKKITYTSNCEETFLLYKKDLTNKVIIRGLFVVIPILGLIGIGSFRNKIHSAADGFIIPLVFIMMIAAPLLLRAIMDLLSSKLEIEKDTFLSLNLVKGVYTVTFKDKKIKRSLPSIFSLKEGDEVYIIYTGDSKKIIDIVPVENIN